MVWLLQIKVDSGASSVRLSLYSGLFESAQILAGHLGENNLLTMLSLSACQLKTTLLILSILLAVDSADRQTCKTRHSQCCERQPKIHWGHH